MDDDFTPQPDAAATPETEMHDDEEIIHLSRRVFIRASGAVVIGAGFTALVTVGCGTQESVAPTPFPATEQYVVPVAPATPPVGQAWHVFTDHEARTVEAYTARLMPGDASDPGAREAGVVNFIDYALSFNDGFDSPAYFQGPFALAYKDTPPANVDPSKSVPVKESTLDWYGYQSNLNPVQHYRQGIVALDKYANGKFGKDFVALSEEQQDTIIGEMEAGKTPKTGGGGGGYASSGNIAVGVSGGFSGEATGNFAADMGSAFVNPSAIAFFSMLRAHTAQGMFADPQYGGNRNFAGWRLVGFPGAQGGYTPLEMHTDGTKRQPQGLAQVPPGGHAHPGSTGAVYPVSGSGPGFTPGLPPIKK